MSGASGGSRPDAGELRVALLGYGLAGAAFHGPLVAATPGLTLASVVTANPERAARARCDHPGATVLDRAEPLFAEPEAHDLVIVASPNRTHASLAASALEAGLHVVVDKPLAASSADGRRLAELAEGAGRLLTVFHNRRWDGDLLTLQRLMAEGALGEVQRFESRFERWRPEVRADSWRELAGRDEAGGVLFDLGSHLIDQALVLFGEVTGVYAELDSRRPGAQVDDDVFIALTHASGTRSHLWASQAAAQTGPRMRALGPRGAYVKWGMDVQEDALRAGARPEGPDWGVEPREQWGMAGAGDGLVPVETERGDYRLFYSGVVAALRDGAPPPVSVREAIAVLDVIESALDADAARRPAPQRAGRSPTQ